MHCPSCGTATAADQKFCRRCGLSLETVAQLMTKEMPDRIDFGKTVAKDRQSRTEYVARLGFWGVKLLAIAGTAIFALIAYKIINGLIIEKGEVIVGLTLLLALVGGAMVVTSLGYADAVRKFKSRVTDEVEKTRPRAVSGRVSDPWQVVGVTEGTTELLESADEGARPIAQADRIV